MLLYRHWTNHSGRKWVAVRQGTTGRCLLDRDIFMTCAIFEFPIPRLNVQMRAIYIYIYIYIGSLDGHIQNKQWYDIPERQPRQTLGEWQCLRPKSQREKQKLFLVDHHPIGVSRWSGSSVAHPISTGKRAKTKVHTRSVMYIEKWIHPGIFVACVPCVKPTNVTNGRQRLYM